MYAYWYNILRFIYCRIAGSLLNPPALAQIKLKCMCSAPQCTLQTRSNTWNVPAMEAVNTPTFSLHCTYTSGTLQVHSSSIWAGYDDACKVKRLHLSRDWPSMSHYFCMPHCWGLNLFSSYRLNSWVVLFWYKHLHYIFQNICAGMVTLWCGRQQFQG